MDMVLLGIGLLITAYNVAYVGIGIHLGEIGKLIS